MGVYAHTGRYVGTEWLTDEDLSPQEYATQARGWVSQGAQVVGGCCGTTPEHIQALKDVLPSRIPG
jgi:S-methylmethionine-dependent homocysteine/selenocysteine methylase